ncbi:DUF1501 domain-containing protein [Sulfurirhabdus autotrophica]|uniref:Uncharacterized protein (DUF1501 family) n=1 Tax=Sulfurirhabdus autotrophica TaxID=1706046 RepID=A0A4R3Y623_9PROT|nr:DUF1501 domain-containing protein [Sulfurirhabdus autotrophica]TCV85914.1 uncharacterized protein (DUF1501 family) [Sulfurirhabdus autotrophica]
MQRRAFLKILGLIPLIPYSSNLAFAAAPAGNYRNLLVLLELKGGNDGLNTVIPYSDSEYYSLRPRIAIPRDHVLQLDGVTGLHPSLQAMMPLWQGGEMAVIQGVGYPEPNLSHFRSIEIWETASSSKDYLPEGWLSRVFDAYPPPQSFAADGIVVGSQELGPMGGGNTRAVVLSNTEQFLRQSKEAGDMAGSVPNAALAHVLKVESDIRQAASNITVNFPFKTEFPKSQLSNALKTAAQVVAGNAGIAVVKVTHNGFDTHSNQIGTQARLLKEMAEGLVAFKSALTELNRWDSTLIMSYAEFGRRPKENASGGTDHGTANAHFMLGGRVKGGLYGTRPQLAQLEGGNLSYGLDFRSLYATAIEKWWGGSASRILGGRFSSLDVLKA